MTTDEPVWSEPQPVPDGTWHRTATVRCAHRGCPDGTLVVNVMTKEDGPVPPSTQALVTHVGATAREVLDDALAYLVATARADPSSVGLDGDAVVEVALVELSLVVDESDEWLVHVGECPFPAADPYGIAVRMRGLQPVGLELLEDVQEL
ncbi:hypothetical protein [Cellulomonas oligotrophica]|uniref:Uncharacterized protein n=1 Tax=Cellulomonas oligotrophica TaxID=931536 RepID=A0A7Y9FG02_9CELL|nr:hypothetical protein [Cellulomonas oligotrophica]NYD86197.1 hypothetical protein [Cellulomonas oligotrophica]GIG34290.1 hypothetical protein Col01nite_34490 [Cellulomonas oligotrophica]